MRRSPTVLRLSQIQGLPVIDTRIARQAGLVADVLLSPVDRVMQAIDVQYGGGWFVQRIPAAVVRTVGTHVVLVDGSVDLEFSPPHAKDPTWVGSRAILGMEVFTLEGDLVGHVADAFFNTETFQVLHYELARPRWARWLRPKRVYPEQVVGCSEDLMLIQPARRLSESTSQEEPQRASMLEPAAGGS